MMPVQKAHGMRVRQTKAALLQNLTQLNANNVSTPNPR